MTNKETIEKLNEALSQLIDAYEVLQNKNDNLEDQLKQKNEEIITLENELEELNGNTEVQSNKMDGMLSRIQTLLSPTKSEINEEIHDDTTNNDIQQDLFDDEDIDLKIDDEESTDSESSNKIDLGRMESLLNGLNTK